MEILSDGCSHGSVAIDGGCSRSCVWLTVGFVLPVDLQNLCKESAPLQGLCLSSRHVPELLHHVLPVR